MRGTLWTPTPCPLSPLPYDVLPPVTKTDKMAAAGAASVLRATGSKAATTAAFLRHGRHLEQGAPPVAGYHEKVGWDGEAGSKQAIKQWAKG